MSTKRRVIGGIGAGLAGIGEAWLNSIIEKERRQALTAQQGDAKLLDIVTDLLKSGNSHLLSPEMKRRAGGIFNLDAATDVNRLGAPLVESIRNAKTVTELPTELDLLNTLQSKGADITPVPQRQANAPTAATRAEFGLTGDELPSANYMPAHPSGVGNIVGQLDARLKAILGEEGRQRGLKLNKVDSVDPTGRKQTQFIPETEIAGQTFFTEPTPEQAGANKGAELLAGELSDPVTGAKVKQEGQIAGARKRAELQQEAARLGLTTQQQSAALALSDNFMAESKDYFAVADAFRRIVTASTRPSPAGDMALVFSYMKMLDPGSSVREGEYANAQNATGIPGQIMNAYNRAIDGTLLDANQRKDFVGQAGSMYQSVARDHGQRVELFKQRSRQFGVPDFLVLREPDPELLNEATADDREPIRLQPSHGPAKPYEIISVRPAGGR